MHFASAEGKFLLSQNLGLNKRAKILAKLIFLNKNKLQPEKSVLISVLFCKGFVSRLNILDQKREC